MCLLQRILPHAHENTKEDFYGACVYRLVGSSRTTEYGEGHIIFPGATMSRVSLVTKTLSRCASMTQKNTILG